MSASNIKSLEKEAFLRRTQKLSAQESISDDAFADAVYTAISHFGIDENAFRTAFGVSKGTPARWTTRQNLPQPAARAAILHWLAEAVAAQT